MTTSPPSSRRLAAVALADLTGERIRGLEILTRATTELHDHRQREDVSSLSSDLARRFRGFDRTALRAAPDLARRVLRGVGASEPSVLLHAAAEVGDLTDVFVPDAYALAQLLRQTTTAAAPHLQALARAVGAYWGSSSPETLMNWPVRRCGWAGRARPSGSGSTIRATSQQPASWWRTGS